MSAEPIRPLEQDDEPAPASSLTLVESTGPDAANTGKPEVGTAVDTSGIVWRQSSFCIPVGGKMTCVEIARQGATVAIRDKKHPDGPALTFRSACWDGFIAGADAGEFDLPDVAASASLSNAVWINSTWEDEAPGNRVEVAFLADEVAVRDSDRPETHLLFTLAEWGAFLRGARAGEFDV